MSTGRRRGPLPPDWSRDPAVSHLTASGAIRQRLGPADGTRPNGPAQRPPPLLLPGVPGAPRFPYHVNRGASVSDGINDRTLSRLSWEFGIDRAVVGRRTYLTLYERRPDPGYRRGLEIDPSNVSSGSQPTSP
jgi:hypothetical protein